ncbi:MAG: hypothetical protein HY820_43900 [Acidobacteria bacterium]|nr:hypothetical protein [Acidobacteriota bacterium]
MRLSTAFPQIEGIHSLRRRSQELLWDGHTHPEESAGSGNHFDHLQQVSDGATEQKFGKQQQHFFDLLPEGETNFGLDPSWVKIHPYQLMLGPGSVQKAEVRVQHYRPTPMKMEISLVTPAEWQITPETLVFEAPAKGHARQAFTITVPKGRQAPSPRLAIAADVRAGGRYLGQITEAVVDVG